MRDRQTCVGCGKKSPETETNYTLISAQFGWRLTRYKNPDGTLVVEWRCPTCWREYKRARTSLAPEPSSGPPSSGTQRATPIVRTPLPRPPTPFESFRPRNPSSSGELPHVRSPIPPPPPPAPSTRPPPPAATRPVPPRPSTPPRPSSPPRPPSPGQQPSPSTIPTDRPRRNPVR
ncbi:MAG TPA: hypothetical protein VF765_29325 [Polyangiaceae bacterium]